MPMKKLADRLASLLGETASLDQWLKFTRWRRDMEACGFDTIVKELVAQRYVPDEAADVVFARFYRKAFDQLTQQDAVLSEFETCRQQNRPLFPFVTEAITRSFAHQPPASLFAGV